jgi:hypothetical protein
MGGHQFHIPEANTVHDVELDEKHGRLTVDHPAAMLDNSPDEIRRRLHEASEAIDAKHRTLGGAPGTAVGAVTPGQGLGFYQLYSEGAIYWRHDLGATELYGAVYQRYASMGGADSSSLGYPIKDQTTDPDGAGQVGVFEYGSIYWNARTGAFEVHGNILDSWKSLGDTQGWLGYPVSDEYDDGQGGRRSDFENGRISWTPDDGARSEPQWLRFTYSPIVFGTGITIGGKALLTLYSNGATHFEGQLHDNGLASYDTLVAAAVYDTDHNAIVFTHTGQANGSLSDGSPDDNWDDWKQSADLVTLWSNLKAGSSSRTVNHVDGYMVFANVIGLFGDLYNAVFDGSSGSSTDDPYQGTYVTGEEALPPSALRLN